MFKIFNCVIPQLGLLPNSYSLLSELHRALFILCMGSLILLLRLADRSAQKSSVIGTFGR